MSNTEHKSICDTTQEGENHNKNTTPPKKEMFARTKWFLGTKYYKQEVSRLAKRASFPMLRNNISRLKAEARATKNAEEIDSSELSKEQIANSIIGHSIILAALIPTSVLAFYFFVYSLGAFFYNDHYLPTNNYSLYIAPLFLLFALPRLYISFKSLQFFRIIRKERSNEVRHEPHNA